MFEIFLKNVIYEKMKNFTDEQIWKLLLKYHLRQEKELYCTSKIGNNLENVI